jgi:membrane-associated phospholipid phosphatase
MKRQLASLTSGVLNPFLVSVVVILLLSFESASSVSDAVKWLLIFVTVSILPVFLVIIYLAHNDKLEGIFINVRGERHKIYLLAVCSTAAGCILLFNLGAPMVLVASLVAGLSAVFVFMCINLLWKISIHTAFMAASVAALTIVYGSVGVLAVMLVPPVAWARIEMKHHSLAQTIAGALLAVLIVVVVFRLFDLA